MILLTSGTSEIAQSITAVVGWIPDVIELLVKPPLVYFLGVSIIISVIKVFGRAKQSVGN